MKLKLLVGLGNPGPSYVVTRHNVGVWWIEAIASLFNVDWHAENKFSGKLAQITFNNEICWLLIPTTFMNLSGQAVSAFVRFHKILPESILIAHDELSFEPGVIRFKEGGGHGGHNGLRSIISHLHDPNFSRLRIGIGHPGHKDEVSDYVLSKPSTDEKSKIEQSINKTFSIVQDLILGNSQLVFRQLHQD